jgi:hypothetical protein
MFESSVPQSNNDLDAEKGPGCDIRNRFTLSLVYQIPGYNASNWTRKITGSYLRSSKPRAVILSTISVFGDTADAGTILGENPIRANYTGQPVFGPGTHTTDLWFNPAAFSTPPAYTFGNLGRNTVYVYGPGLQTVDVALVPNFALKERLGFQIRGEAFNALNHTNLGTPNRFVNEPQFGTITDAATPARELQVAARLSF